MLVTRENAREVLEQIIGFCGSDTVLIIDPPDFEQAEPRRTRAKLEKGWISGGRIYLLFPGFGYLFVRFWEEELEENLFAPEIYQTQSEIRISMKLARESSMRGTYILRRSS